MSDGAQIIDLEAALKASLKALDKAPDPKAAWLKMRESVVGASEVPVVLEVSPFAKPYTLWARKCGFVEAQEETEAMKWGSRLEPIVAEAYAEETKRKLVDHGRYALRRAEKWPFLGATLDREIVPVDDRGPGALECKTTDGRYLEDWDGDEPPLHYQLQLQAQLAVTGWKWGVLACLVGGRHFRAFELQRNDSAIALIVERCEKFWQHVVTATPPPVDGSEATKRALRKVFQRETEDETSIVLPYEANEWTAAWLAADAEEKAANARKLEAENKLCAAIGSAAFGVLDGQKRRWSWRTQTRVGYTVQPTTTRVLRLLKSK